VSGGSGALLDLLSFPTRRSSDLDSAFSGSWTTPARRILLFLSDGALPRVGFCNSWAMDRSRAWEYAIPGRWIVPARGNPRFLSRSEEHTSELQSRFDLVSRLLSE